MEESWHCCLLSGVSGVYRSGAEHHLTMLKTECLQAICNAFFFFTPLPKKAGRVKIKTKKLKKGRSA